MSLKALFIANAVMILFVSVVFVQSFIAMNSSGVVDKMHESGMVELSAEKNLSEPAMSERIGNNESAG